MNTDIRLSVGFWQHPKTKKTVKRLGFEGIRSLQVLWLWAAVNRPDGALSGMDWEDIELAADWMGEERAFFNDALGRWIDETEGGYVLHDWTDHNPWQAEAEARSESARKAAKARWGNADASKAQKGKDADSMRSQCAGNADEFKAQCPSPLLSSPNQKKEDISTPPKVPPVPEVLPPESVSVDGGECEKYFEPSLEAREGKRETPRANSRREGINPRALGTNPRALGTNPRAQPVPEPASDGEVFDIECSLEFQELRELYNREGVLEAPMTGHIEFMALCKKKQWPGLGRIAQALNDLRNDFRWMKDGGQFRPGLARFLRERYWTKPIDAAARASPPLTERQRQAEQSLAASRYLEDVKNGRTGNHCSAIGDAQPSLSAQYPELGSGSHSQSVAYDAGQA